MKTILLCVFAATSSLLAQPQTNTSGSTNQFTVTTNYVASHPDFRVVNGQLYNARKSNLWRNHSVEVVSRSGNITLAKTYDLKHEYETRWYPGTPRSDWERAGGGGPGGVAAGYRRTKIGTKTVYGPTIAFTNSGGLTIGTQTIMLAMRVGKTASGAELWDCGTPQFVPVLVTNAPATDRSPANPR